MTRLAKHPLLTRAAAIVLALILSACVWLLVALVMMSSVGPTSHLPI